MIQSLKVFILRLYYRLASWWAWRGQLAHEVAVDPLHLPLPGQSLDGRLYRVPGSDERPLILYLHGGGWVIGDLDTHDPFCRALAAAVGCNVLSVDYRLAPEHPFPAAHEDAAATLAWIAADPERAAAGGNGRLILAGDSAGGNLATCTCLEAQPEARERIDGAIILYPATDYYSAAWPSYSERATGQTLTRDLMIWFWDTYLGSTAPEAAERAFPHRSQRLDSHPPAFLITAELDPLRDEGIGYAEKLRQAGVPVHYRHYQEAAHGFACSEGNNPDAREMLSELDTWLRGLGGASRP